MLLIFFLLKYTLKTTTKILAHYREERQHDANKNMLVILSFQQHDSKGCNMNPNPIKAEAKMSDSSETNHAETEDDRCSSQCHATYIQICNPNL